MKVTSLARRQLEKGCDLYEEGKPRQAARYFLAAAKAGCVEAQVNLANLYDAGEGVEKNFSTAVYWYKKAVAGGCCYGASGLAASYRARGQTRWAVYWLKKALQMGDSWAQEDLDKLDKGST